MLRYVLRTCCAICAALACTLAAPQGARAQMVHTGQPDTARKCAICHFQWVYQFYTEQRDGELVAKPDKEVVATSAMCLSCHDGSVADSRNAVFNGPGHRGDTVPTKAVTIPKDFPLDDSGKMQCFTCHTPHALPGDPDSEMGLFLRAPNEASSLCRMCHTDKQGGPRVGNHSIDISSPRQPPEIIQGGGKFGSSLTNQLICETCHVAHGGINNTFLVLSVEDPETRSILCESCHTKNPDTAKNAAKPGSSHPVDITPQEARIPERWTHGGRVHLGKRGELVCLTCHSPHNAVEANALLADRNYRDSLCQQCHTGQRTVLGSSHDLRLSAPGETNSRGRRAADTGPCSVCHLAHGGNGGYLWARPPEPSGNRLDQLCLGCHAPGRCGQDVAPKNNSHPVGIEMVSLHGLSCPVPLFGDTGKRKPVGTIRCLTCHQAHTPGPLSETGDRQKYRKGPFLRFPQDSPSRLCEHCHVNHRFVRNTDHDLLITGPDYRNALGMAPARDGVCSPCHAAHNAVSKKFLWAGPLGPALPDGWNPSFGSEAAVMVRFCTGCHTTGGCAESQIPDFGLHPKGFVVPEEALGTAKTGVMFDMMKEAFPVFTDTGEHSTSGNIVCSTCHNAHQWDPRDPQNRPGENIEGSVLNSFLRPGLHSQFCTVCHGEEGLFRFKYFHSSLSRTKGERASPFED